MFFYLEYFLFINIPTSLDLMKYIDWKTVPVRILCLDAFHQDPSFVGPKIL